MGCLYRIIVLLLLITFFTTGTVAQNTARQRFALPAGYQHLRPPIDSFGQWLQNLPLKPAGTHTLTYSGAIARTDAYTAAVINISIGGQDLQQCADAVMRLRAEYLYNKKNYNDIHFNFTSGFNCDYIHFANGYRYREPGKWVLMEKKDYGYKTFMQYMTLVFSYAGTLSLDKELKKVTSENELQAGDIFIRGGSPGHCFIVLDVVINATGKKEFMLAQSFMPAQNIQVLRQQSGPWFDLHSIAEIPYGELISLAYLKRF